MFLKRKKMWLLAGLLAGVFLIWSGLRLAMWHDAQTMYYNIGLQAYTNGDMPTAVAAFNRSLDVYKHRQRLDWIERVVYPKPSAEIAALADFHKGKALVRAQQLKEAAAAFQESLFINPGEGNMNISDEEKNRLRQQAMDVKYDLELLFKNSPELAPGKGKGKGPEGEGKGHSQVPGNDPGNKPGKGNRDDI